MLPMCWACILWYMTVHHRSLRQRRLRHCIAPDWIQKRLEDIVRVQESFDRFALFGVIEQP
jgi:hypothetical protein